MTTTTTTTNVTAKGSISCPTDPLRLSSRNSQLTEMATNSQEHVDAYEALDLTEFGKNQPWWRKLFGQETRSAGEKYSVATQLLIGGITGWCTGFIFQKVGKLAATAVGGGIILLELANHTGHIKVDWNRVEKDMKKAKEQLKIPKRAQLPTGVKSKAEELGVVHKAECISNWRIFWRLCARYGILKGYHSTPTVQQPLYTIVEKSRGFPLPLHACPPPCCKSEPPPCASAHAS